MPPRTPSIPLFLSSPFHSDVKTWVGAAAAAAAAAHFECIIQACNCVRRVLALDAEGKDASKTPVAFKTVKTHVSGATGISYRIAKTFFVFCFGGGRANPVVEDGHDPGLFGPCLPSRRAPSRIVIFVLAMGFPPRPTPLRTPPAPFPFPSRPAPRRAVPPLTSRQRLARVVPQALHRPWTTAASAKYPWGSLFCASTEAHRR